MIETATLAKGDGGADGSEFGERYQRLLERAVNIGSSCIIAIEKFQPVDPPATEAGSKLESLTERERRTLSFVAGGMTNIQIATQEWLSEQTIKGHLSNIYKKLGVTNRVEAAAFIEPDTEGGVIAAWKKLTDREREVAKIVASGMGNAAIGGVLGISEQTVKFHVSSILLKTGTNNRQQIAIIARSVSGKSTIATRIRVKAKCEQAIENLLILVGASAVELKREAFSRSQEAEGKTDRHF